MSEMPVNAHRNDFPECTPKRLIKALCDAGSERELSRRLGVNILYVSQLLRKGIEPTDQTEKGRETRAKMFLPKRKRKMTARKPQAALSKQIRSMARETADAVVRHKPSRREYPAVKKGR